MKMSLCNTFRFFAVSTTVVLCIVGSPVPGIGKRQGSIGPTVFNQDLERQESITVEIKSDIKRPNDINSVTINNAKDDINSFSLTADISKKNVNKNIYPTIASTDMVLAQNTDAIDAEKDTQIPLELVTELQQSSTVLNKTIIVRQNDTTVSTPIRDNDTKPGTNIETIDNNKPNEQGTDTQKIDKIEQNQTEETTNSELERSTHVPLLDVKEDTLINNKIDTGTFAPVTNTLAIISETSSKPMESSSWLSEVTTPTWKKYNIIERKRVSPIKDEPHTSTDTSTDNTELYFSTISETQVTVTDKSEVMVKSESAQGRISLQDAITSDIPSLEKLKSDLLSFTKFSNKSDFELTTDLLSTEEIVTKTDVTTLITTTSPFNINPEAPNTVSSKRAGYLDLSAKNMTAEDDLRLKPNGTESLEGPFDAETPDIHEESDDKVEKGVGSQSQLDEDAIKEELLKEEMLNDSEEISQRHRGDGKQIETNTSLLSNTDKANLTQFEVKPVQEENLSVRPISAEKSKNTVLYPVNPNYKPLKKIEVQPAKPFVRDPDDNSWRNESLSSLGIVFKPKNSSKPFTQVLKNKTETEWNNFSEKDIKSDVPDLRVRLEQIAQKRKSKKKKIDSYGNVFYTDYEENSSSEENTSTPKDLPTPYGTVSTTEVSKSRITIVTPIQSTPLSTSAASDVKANDIPALTTVSTPKDKIETTSKKEPTKVTTLKPPKMFNLFDYYETNDDDDIAEYLNMAKIDLKKYTVPMHTTYTPYTSPPLPILYTNPMTQFTPERKGTIQYFPPRTTKRPRTQTKHNYNREKINPLALTDAPKHVLPISYHKLTTHDDGSVQYTNRPDMATIKEDFSPKNFDRNLYLTTPPLTTMPDDDFGVIGNEQGYNRPNYVIKHYKDFMHEAIQEHEHNKHREYAFTEPPAHDVTDFIRPTTARDKTTTGEDYDYESQFRKDLLDRFVANFNEKSNRFKSDFPVVYNNSIVHGASYDEKDVAMSRAYFRRPYSNQDYKPIVRDLYDPNCDNVTVELSPAYELHYYVPEQEEKQEVEAKPINLPVRYSL